MSPQTITDSATAPAAYAGQAPMEQPQTVERVLQRVVLPADRDLDVLPLYVDYGAAIAISSEDVEDDERARAAVLPATSTALHPENILDRRRLRVPADQRVSFATYFNAFPASYWRMWSVVEQVLLRVRVSGSATVIAYRSTPDGRSQRVGSLNTEEDPTGDFSFRLPLKPFGDGGWYWFDVFAGTQDAILEEAGWYADVPAGRATSGTATVGITLSLNRGEFCLDLLTQLASDPDVMAVLDEVLVIDQSPVKLRELERFADVEAAMAGTLRVIEQGNIGGSGGFARAQYETAKAARSDYALMLDDDIVAEPESIIRAITFADLCRRPTLVGGHMFSLYSRSQLHSFGEAVNPWRFWWGPAAKVKAEHDLAARNLRNTRWMHRRVDVDFNGWWMCLIPRVVIDDIGLGLPLFIKWDDAEYGIRAGAAGYPTVSMPGVAVWHVPWTDKNDALDWQAYFHQRNRTVAALLHSPYDFGGRVVRESFNHQVKHLLAMQYSTAQMRLHALEDILEGPDHLHAGIMTKLSEVRALRSDHPDAQSRPHADSFPMVKVTKPPKRGHQLSDPKGIAGQVKAAAMGGVRQLLPVRRLARTNPEARVAARDAKWWRLAQLDSAIVSTTDGTAASWFRRNPRQFQLLLARTIAVHERFLREWPRLAKEYRSALPEISSPQAWEVTFKSAAAPPREGTQP